MFKYIKVEPPSYRYRKEDVAYVPLATCEIFDLDLLGWLQDGEPFNMEDVERHCLATARREDFGKTPQEATDAIHSEVAKKFVQLLNRLAQAPSGGEFSELSTFQLVEDKETERSEHFEVHIYAVVRVPFCVKAENYEDAAREVLEDPKTYDTLYAIPNYAEDFDDEILVDRLDENGDCVEVKTVHFDDILPEGI